ncbi:MAG: hypothetical protein RIQ41_37 [Candidatus Parcubacteria bacterium]
MGEVAREQDLDVVLLESGHARVPFLGSGKENQELHDGPFCRVLAVFASETTLQLIYYFVKMFLYPTVPNPSR